MKLPKKLQPETQWHGSKIMTASITKAMQQTKNMNMNNMFVAN